MNDEFCTVPVLVDFDSNKPIGELRILRSALPPSPEFVLTIGFMAHEMESAPGSIPSRPYVGRYDLCAVSLSSDDAYIGYLRQVGKLPPLEERSGVRKPGGGE
jgi:hypothetical protein